MSLHSLIANGGCVLVVGGLNKAWEDYRGHAQLKFWTGDTNEIQRQIKSNDNRLPENTRAVILSRFLSHQQKRPLLDDARRRRAIIFDNRNEADIRKTLDEILDRVIQPEPTTEEKIATSSDVKVEHPPVVVHQEKPKGWLKDFVEKNISTEGSHVEEGRRLLTLIEKEGFKSTLNSVTQQVGLTRRKLNIGVTPTEVTPPVQKVAPVKRSPKVIEAIALLDDAITNLGLVKLALQEINDTSELLAKISALVKK